MATNTIATVIDINVVAIYTIFVAIIKLSICLSLSIVTIIDIVINTISCRIVVPVLVLVAAILNIALIISPAQPYS